MSSGNFPVREDSVEGCKLLAASDLVTEVINALGADYSQYDDAERYGGSIALLRLAAKLIVDQVLLNENT